MAQKPYGLFVKNDEPTRRDLNFIAAVVHRFSTYKAEADLNALRQVHDLPDGGTMLIQDAADLFRVIVDKQHQKEYQLEKNGYVKPYIPMFFSGVITRASVRDDQKVSIKITEQCRRRLERATDSKAGKELSLERLTIDQSYDFPEFIPKEEGVLKRTQYFAHNPAWYSGAMAEVMQIVGGYGKQEFEALPDHPIERAQIILPETIFKEIWPKYQNVRLPGYEGVPPVDGQFQYDYKWAKTHGIAFDSNQNPWLVEISDAVYVMPLPIIPLTADALFRKYVEEELQDTEIIKILDKFKALPSGESFPKDKIAFDRWLRAGVIIKVCDVADFRNQQSMFTACGWSFNTHGHSAYNTGYSYDSKGLINCHTYSLTLTLNPSLWHYGTEAVNLNDSQLSSEEKNQIAKYLNHIFNHIRGGDDVLRNSLLYKFRHVDQNEILARSGASNFEAEVEYWDNYQAQPMANHTGHVKKVYSGYLYHPAKPEFQPQIKFPFFEMDGCISFDFSALESGVSAKCDTIMYAYYEGDDLKVVKYFYDNRTFNKVVDTDYEEYMIVGKWYMNEYQGDSRISGNFYTTDIDERKETSGTTVETTIEGRDHGYDSKPHFAFDYFGSIGGTMWRNRYFSHLTKSLNIEDRSVVNAILIPMFNRFTVLHAYKENEKNKTYRESLELFYITDPTSYRYWTYDFVFAWHGNFEKRTGQPYPVNGNPVWVEIENYSPTPYSDFADQGPWVPGLPADYTWLIHPKSSEWNHSGGGGAPKIHEYSKNEYPTLEEIQQLKWQIKNFTLQIKTKDIDRKYFTVSPDQNGNMITRTSSKVSFGDSEYVNISEINEQRTYRAVGQCSLVDSKSNYHFVGVINE
ncbi:hypothetical protein [Acinetobacter sp. BSP-28]|uniref:hypothetical protein n=1 Tax=Acinetobacter sp. BSP-28 TaxID=3344661 RepID=UPI00377041A9